MIVFLKLDNPETKEKLTFELGRDNKPVIKIKRESGDGRIQFIDRPLSRVEIKGMIKCLEEILENGYSDVDKWEGDNFCRLTPIGVKKNEEG